MRTIVSGLLLAAVAATSAACGGDGTSDVLSPDPIARAARATLQKGSSRVDVVVTMRPSGAPRAYTIKGTGVTNAKATATAMTLDFSDVLKDTDYEGPTAGQQISRGLVLYWKFPMFEGELPSGKKWVKVNLVTLARKQGASSSEIAEMTAGQDPQQTLRNLRASDGHVEKLGQDDIRGAPATHYRATIGLKKALAGLSKRERAATRKLFRGKGALRADVWIDGKGLVRRDREEFPGGSFEMTFYDFGLQINIQPPPRDETIDILDLVGEN